MYSSSLLVLALAVFGASAQTLISSGCGLNGVSGLNGGLITGVSGINGGLIGGVSGINGGLIGGVSGINGGLIGGVSGINGGLIGSSVASTPVLENVPLRLPSILHPTAVQESCNCIKTVVRPQMRKEVYTIPSVQRFFQTTSTPIVETVPYVSGSAVDVPTVGGVESGIVGTGISGLNAGVVTSGLGLGSGIVAGGLGSGVVSSGLGSGVVASGLGLGSGVVTGGLGLNGVSGVVSTC